MVKHTVRSAFLLVAALMLAACSQKLNLEVRARMDAQPMSRAKVMVDGQEQGITDSTGVFAKSIQRKPGAEVEVLVVKELPGYRIKPWKTSFLVKLPKDGAVDKYTFDADLQATRFVTLAATENGAPVADATVSVNDKEIGKTDDRGVYAYAYDGTPGKRVQLALSLPGYIPEQWKTAVTLAGPITIQRY